MRSTRCTPSIWRPSAATSRLKNLRLPRAEILFGQPADAAEKIRSYIKKARGRRRTALETCTAADLAQLAGGAMPVNMDKYLTLRYPEPATILDYFDDPLLILEEPASLREAERATAVPPGRGAFRPAGGRRAGGRTG